MNADMNGKSEPRAADRGKKPRSGDRPLGWPGDPESLTADAVDFEALAHVLANTCRRGGRLRRFHSVAAHAVLMSEAVETVSERGTEDNRTAALHALLADASVAWLGAETGSSQRGAERQQRLRAAVDRAVREAVGLDGELSAEQAELLRFVARMAEAAEDRDLPGARDGAAPAVAFPPLKRRIRTVEPDRAAKLWLERFQSLRGQAGAGSSTPARSGGPNASSVSPDPKSGGPSMSTEPDGGARRARS